MEKYDFWKSWKNVSGIERRAIQSMIKARQFVINAVPRKYLKAIYIKGSFARREMNAASDVDMVPIVTENKYQGVVFEVNDQRISPVMVVPLSLGEFKKNKLHTKSDHYPDLRARPDRFLRFIDHCKLIYGSPINPHMYPVRSDKRALDDEYKVIMQGYIPASLAGRIDARTLAKEVVWMTELEQLSKKISLTHTFQGIAESVSRTDHIIHQAVLLRRKKSSKKEINKFIVKLQAHISSSQ